MSKKHIKDNSKVSISKKELTKLKQKAASFDDMEKKIAEETIRLNLENRKIVYRQSCIRLIEIEKQLNPKNQDGIFELDPNQGNRAIKSKEMLIFEAFEQRKNIITKEIAHKLDIQQGMLKEENLEEFKKIKQNPLNYEPLFEKW